MRVRIGYPEPEAEVDILSIHSLPGRLDELEPVATAANVRKLIELAREVHVADAIKEYIVALLGRTRDHEHAYLGASPRAGIMLLRAARVAAASDGRAYVVPDDIKALAEPVLSHRIIPSPEAQLGGVGAESVVEDALAQTPVPKRAQS